MATPEDEPVGYILPDHLDQTLQKIQGQGLEDYVAAGIYMRAVQLVDEDPEPIARKSWKLARAFINERKLWLEKSNAQKPSR